MSQPDLTQLSTEELIRLRQQAAQPQRQPSVISIPRSPTAVREREVGILNTESQIGSRGVQDANTQANTARTALEIDELERRARQADLTADQYATRRDQFLQLPFLRDRIDELQFRFDRDFSTPYNPLEYGGIRSANTEFDTTSGSLRAYVAAALGLTGQQFNTPAEQEAFIGSILPSAGDRDGVIRSKIQTLNKLFENAYGKGLNYGFRWPAAFTFEFPADSPMGGNWRFRPEEDRQALDIIRSDLPVEDAARQVLALARQSAGASGEFSEAEFSAAVRNIQTMREELARPEGAIAGFRYRVAQPQPQQETSASPYLDGLLRSTGDIVEGAMSIPGLLANPLNAGLNLTGLPQLLMGEPLGTDLGGSAREALNLPRNEGVLGEVNRAVAGGLFPAGLVRTGANFFSRNTPELVSIVTGAQAPRTTGQVVAQSLAATPRTDAAVGAAGATAAEVVRQEGGGAGAQFLASLAAGAPTAAAGRATRFAVDPEGTAGTGALAVAADRENITLMPGDTGGKITQSATAGANLLPLAADPLANAGEASVASVERAVRRNADRSGDVLSPLSAGNVVQEANNRLIGNTMQSAGARLDTLSQAAGGVRPPATTAVQLLNERIDRLNAMPERNADEIAELTTLRDDLSRGGGIGLEGLRDLRTDLRSGLSFSGRVRSSREQNFNKQLSAALGNDIEAGLADRPEALAAYRDFNQFYSGQAEIMDVFSRVVGEDRSGEQIAAGLRSMAGSRGDRQALTTIMGNLEPEEAGNLRATIIDGLGRSATQPDAPFSLSAFVRNWQSIPSSTKRAVFGDSDVYDSLDRIYRVAENMKVSQQYADNPSGTARGLVGLGGAAAIPGPLVFELSQDTATGGSILVAAVLSGAIAGGQRMYGNVLANPDFARWLSRAPRTNDPLALRNYAARLTTIAAQNPSIAADLEAMQSGIEANLEQPEAPARTGVLAE